MDVLYGRSCRLGNPGKDQYVDVGGAGAQQRAHTAVDGCPRRQHVIDQNQAAAGHGGLAVTGHTKRALDIGGAFGPR